MERLGFWGIIKLTTHIILTNLQHFLCITLLSALPNALIFIVYGHFGKVLIVASMSLLYKISSSQAGAFDPSHLTPSEEALIANQPPLFLLLLINILSVSISLLCTILVTFSACRAICLNKSVDLKGSLREVPRFAKSLVLTAMLAFGVVFVVGSLGMVIIAAGLSAVEASVRIPITIVGIGVVGGALYMAIIEFSLANTVAILEEKKGWEAISRSTHLIKGSRWVAVELYGLYGVLSMGTLFLTASEEASVVWRWVAGGVSVGLQSFIVVYAMASRAVMYMSCKSGQGEPLDTLLAASSQFGLLESAPKYLDLETAPFATIPHNK